MTGEPKGITEKWVEQHGATYAYAYDKGESLFRAVGASGRPHAVLIDPSGTIVWSGHPARLDDKMIEAHLGSALPIPLWEWPASADKVKKAFRDGALAAAVKHIEALGDDDFKTSVKLALETMLSARVKGFAARLAHGDLMGIDEDEAAMLKAVEGSAGAQVVQVVQDAITAAKAHPDRKRILAGQKEVREVRDGKLRSKSDLREAIEKLEKIESKYVGTYAQTEAAQLRKMLVARLS